MEIKPTPMPELPEYPPKAGRARRMAQRLEGTMLRETEEVPPPPVLTREDCRVLRRILKEGMAGLSMQMLGGEALEDGSAAAKAQERRYRSHTRAYERMLQWLDWWEQRG